MKITIHRGQGQIGGNIIEIASQNTRIILDVGETLLPVEFHSYPVVEGLFDAKNVIDAILISHYHSDHSGLLDKVDPNIPVYMAEKAYRILLASNEYRNIQTVLDPIFYYNQVQVIFNDLIVTPYRCDHSAYDAYMFLIESEGKSVLYTGDFRANGRLDFDALMRKLPQVDVLIIEGTTLSREGRIDNIDEELLEDIAIRNLDQYTGPAFILMSAMNIERVITAYNAALKTRRVFLEDLYTASVASAAGITIPNPKSNDNVRVFVTDNNLERYKQLNQYGKSKISRSSIAKTNYLMCIRPSMRAYLEKLNKIQSFENGILFYGMWKGYQTQPGMKEFLDFMQSKGLKLQTLHTSGHADPLTIDQLIASTAPKIIMPVHTENVHWFERYSDNITIISDLKVFEF
jgi:ribonuclease J